MGNAAASPVMRSGRGTLFRFSLLSSNGVASLSISSGSVFFVVLTTTVSSACPPGLLLRLLLGVSELLDEFMAAMRLRCCFSIFCESSIVLFISSFKGGNPGLTSLIAMSEFLLIFNVSVCISSFFISMLGCTSTSPCDILPSRLRLTSCSLPQRPSPSFIYIYYIYKYLLTFAWG